MRQNAGTMSAPTRGLCPVLKVCQGHVRSSHRTPSPSAKWIAASLGPAKVNAMQITNRPPARILHSTYNLRQPEDVPLGHTPCSPSRRGSVRNAIRCPSFACLYKLADVGREVDVTKIVPAQLACEDLYSSAHRKAPLNDDPMLPPHDASPALDAKLVELQTLVMNGDLQPPAHLFKDLEGTLFVHPRQSSPVERQAARRFLRLRCNQSTVTKTRTPTLTSCATGISRPTTSRSPRKCSTTSLRTEYRAA